MKAINTYGMKMKGLKKASGETFETRGKTQISYNRKTGEVLTAYHVGESWTDYHDVNVMTVCNTSRHMTMQEIADTIHEKVEFRKNCDF